jgi:hypothetical protein
VNVSRFFILSVLVSFNLFSQEIQLSTNKLLFPLGQGYHQITMRNTGSASLIIDSIYAKGQLAYVLSIFLKDTTINYGIHISELPLHFSMEAGDSATLYISRPFCAVCKSCADFFDTLVVHSNSLSNNYTYICIEADGQFSSVEDGNTVWTQYALSQNYPNPFNPVTSIPFSLARDGYVTLSVYNNLGEIISILYSGNLSAGQHVKSWDASKFSSGVYFYRLTSTGYNAVRKMVLTK